jgi:hypothetical protein
MLAQHWQWNYWQRHENWQFFLWALILPVPLLHANAAKGIGDPLGKRTRSSKL